MQGKPIHKKYLIVLLFAISLLIYGRTINYEFLWDDQRSHLSNNEMLMKGDLKKIWSKPYDGLYIPLTYTTWNTIKKIALDKQTEKLSPKPFHILNVFTHSINCVLLFLILFLLFKNTTASFIGSLLFAFHPLQMESVAWISEFRGLFSCFFSFSALYILFRHVSQKPATALKEFLFSKAFLFASILFICALLAKPSAIILPLIVIVIAWCFYSLSLKTIAKTMIVWILIMVPIALITSGSQTNDLLQFVAPLPSRIFIFCYSAWFYITKIFMPLKLVPSYGITPQLILEDSWLYIYSGIIIGASVLLFAKREQLKYFFTGYAVLIISILPVSGLVSFYFQRFSNVADRYVYFGMLGVAIAFCYLWMATKKKKYVQYIMVLFLVSCIVLTIKQTPVWKNEFALWDHSMKEYPNQFMAAYNRGVHYGKQGKLDEAIIDYSTALKFNKKDKSTLVNRANALAQCNRYKEALADYNDAIRLDPKDGSIYYNRALTNYNVGNYIACPEDLLKAQEFRFPIDPEFAKAVKEAINRK